MLENGQKIELMDDESKISLKWNNKHLVNGMKTRETKTQTH